MTWQMPYSFNRLLRMIRGHDFSAEHDYDGDDWDTGEPYIFRAYRRTSEVLARRRDQRDANYDPLCDEEKAEFYVSDVALLKARLRHLDRLEEKLDLAVGPRCRTSRYNKKTGKSEDWGPSDDFGE